MNTHAKKLGTSDLLLQHFNGLVVFTFFLLTFLVWGGTGYSIALALLVSAIALWFIQQPKATSALKLLFLALIAMFLMHYWFEARGDVFKLPDLDHPIRFVLIIPVILLMHRIGLARYWFWAGCFAAGLVCGYEAYNYTGQRVQGPFNPIIWGNIALVLAVFVVVRIQVIFKKYMATGNRTKLGQALVWLVPLTGLLLGVAKSGSRGAWLTILLLIGLLILLVLFRAGLKWALLIAATAAMVVVTVYQVPQTTVQHRVDKAIDEMQTFELGQGRATSTGLRLEMWYTSIVAFKEAPLFGLGEAGLRGLEERLHEEGLVHDWVITATSHQHSDALDTLAKGGILGLIILLSFYLALFNLATSFTNPLARLLLRVITLCYIGFGLTNTILIGMNGTMFLLGVIAALTGLERQYQRSEATDHFSEK